MTPSSPTLRDQAVSAADNASAARPRTGGRVAELDGLRGLAILAVLLFHFTATSGPLFYLAHLFQIGWTGVDLFFVLSGYLITGILLDSKGHPHYYRNFLARRSLRIFPLYYASLALCGWVAFYPNAPHWDIYLRQGEASWYLVYLGNVRAFLRNAFPGAAILTPLWSLQVEEQFYLTFPFLVSAVKVKTLAVILSASVAAAFLLRVLLAIVMPANLLGPYTLMPCRMDALAMGGLIAIAYRHAPERLKGRWIGLLTAACAVTFLVICGFISEAPWSVAMRTVGYTAIDLAFAGLLVMLISWRPPALLALCRFRPLVWTGVISYGMYLLHIPASNLARQWLAPLKLTPRGSVELCISVAAAMVAAALSWWLFESQILKLKNRFTR